MLIKKIPVGIYAVNCYILSCEETKKTAIIDPGGDPEEILSYLERNNLEPEFIILTHAHGDHIGGIQPIQEKMNVPVYLHEMDAPMLRDGNKNLSRLIGGPVIELTGDKFLKDNEMIVLGNLKLRIIHTPGHTPGSICINIGNVLFTGDTLFANSIGRTDFQGGSYTQIIDSIKRKLLVFDDRTIVYPGHGPESTIGKERISNPFINK